MGQVHAGTRTYVYMHTHNFTHAHVRDSTPSSQNSHCMATKIYQMAIQLG